MKKLLLFLPALALALTPQITQAQSMIASFDLVDDFLKTNYAGPGAYDIFDRTTGAQNPDGLTDVVVSISNTGTTADDGNNVAWTATDDATGTGLRSTIDPSFIEPGGVTANNSGYRVSQTIQIDFPGLVVEADDITDFGWSSGNTAGIGWEFSLLEYLDASGNPFSTAPTFAPYDSHMPIAGQSGAGSFAADTLTSVTNVGNDLSAAGTNGGDNNVSTNPITLGVTSGTIIGGVRITHFLEDVRGVNNGDTSFTNTINDLDLENFTVAVPEPGSSCVLALVSLVGLARRSRKV